MRSGQGPHLSMHLTPGVYGNISLERVPRRAERPSKRHNDTVRCERICPTLSLPTPEETVCVMRSIETWRLKSGASASIPGLLYLRRTDSNVENDAWRMEKLQGTSLG